MKYYFAPMEGITGYIYRNAHRTFFPGVDKYFTPFISTTQNMSLKTRELNDVLPENNRDIPLIPQILSNNAKDFIRLSVRLKEFGYEEVNLNLGCPSGTVVSKQKGSGFLALREQLDVFLSEIFSAGVTKISVKTRIGKDAPEEFYELIQIFNQYPIEELIIHPRVQKDFYKNKPNLEVFRDAINISKNPVGYNGDLFTAADYHRFVEGFPEISRVMFGRGLVGNPGLIGEINQTFTVDSKLLKAFHDKIYEDYKEVLFGEKAVLFKMKEIWSYMIGILSDEKVEGSIQPIDFKLGEGGEGYKSERTSRSLPLVVCAQMGAKYGKKIRKVQRLKDYAEVVSSLFAGE